MPTLKRGSSGNEVKSLQERLLELGFNPGDVDGIFGGGTDAAVRAFQASEGMLVDGIAGQRTLAALGGTATQIEPGPPLAIAEVTVERVSHMFSDAPIRNIKTYLPPVLQELVAVDLGDKPMVLMALATIRAETAGFEPISEFKSRFNTSPEGHPFDLYDNRRDLGNRGKPDGASFKGRGFVQLTGRDNYQRIGAKIALGDGLVQNPDLANDPDIAARILSAFLKTKEIRIKQALLEGDLRGARRLVNGGSHGLERFSETFRIGQREIPDPA
jgi:peptidoglycan L-alanyl-D-glutamate endopeptidase CwlK